MKKNMVYNLLLAVFILIFAGSGAGIVYKMAVRDRAEDKIKELKTVFEEPFAESETLQNADGGGTKAEIKSLTLEEQLKAREIRLPGYAKLKGQNGDMKGWIQIPGTKVDYPVMQSEGRPDFYLKHNFEEDKSSYGTPYIAESCDLEGKEDNIIVYGHHMKDGTMFGDLREYADEGFYESHPIIWFDTLEQVRAYQIVAVTKASASAVDEDMFALAADKTKRQEFLDEVSRRAFYDTGQAGDNGSPLLVLITCEYSQNEGRLLVVAREMNFNNYEQKTETAEGTR